MAKIVNTYPEKQGMKQVRYDIAIEFCCARCKKNKKSKLISTNNKNETFCNGCYGLLLS